jgi:2-haloacid dehalogenase
MVLAFDVNETLLDLAALDEPFADAFGDAALRPAWFGSMLQLAFVGGLTGRYVDFPTAQRAALEMLARRTGTKLADEQAHAGIAELFDDVLSADEVRQLKPGPRPYGLVAERAGVPIAEVVLVAAHAWDVSGALAAGARAAFVPRPGMVPSPIGSQPELVVEDIGELAERLTSDSSARLAP